MRDRSDQLRCEGLVGSFYPKDFIAAIRPADYENRFESAAEPDIQQGVEKVRALAAFPLLEKSISNKRFQTSRAVLPGGAYSAATHTSMAQPLRRAMPICSQLPGTEYRPPLMDGASKLPS